jgi:hypothetical protein
MLFMLYSFRISLDFSMIMVMAKYSLQFDPHA